MGIVYVRSSRRAKAYVRESSRSKFRKMSQKNPFVRMKRINNINLRLANRQGKGKISTRSYTKLIARLDKSQGRLKL